MTPLTPSAVIDLVEQIGIKKRLAFPFKTILPALAAGVFIAMGGLLSLLVSSGMPGITSANPSWSRLLAGATFPIGLILVVFFGAELFTGNCAHLMPALIRKKISLPFVLLHWLWVWILNFVGALFFVFFLVHLTGLVDASPYHDAILQIAHHKTSASFGVVFLKGIGANWLVCLAVWLGLTTQDGMGRLLALWWPVMAFVVMGYEHSVANMFYLPLAMLQGAPISVSQLFTFNLIPATLGNIVGGALFVGAFLTWSHGSTSKASK